MQDDCELCLEILFAGVASISNSSQVFTHAGDVEAGRELQQVLSIDPILQSGVGHAQDLHRQQLLGVRNGNTAGPCEVERYGAIDNFGLDA